MKEASKSEIVTKMNYKNSQKTSKGDENLRAINIQVKHNQHQLLSYHSIHTESESQPNRKCILFSKFSIRYLKTIKV